FALIGDRGPQRRGADPSATRGCTDGQPPTGRGRATQRAQEHRTPNARGEAGIEQELLPPRHGRQGSRPAGRGAAGGRRAGAGGGGGGGGWGGGGGRGPGVSGRPGGLRGGGWGGCWSGRASGSSAATARSAR